MIVQIVNSTSTTAGSMTATPGSRFIEALIKSIGVIGASEVGDKTFFIAAVMAMRNSRWTIFSGALSALAVMTVLSALLGWAAPNLISKTYTHYAATILFFFFGFKTLYDTFFGEEGENELEQVEQELSNSNSSGSKRNLTGEDEKKQSKALTRLLYMLFSPVFLKAFTLTFLAEWGDRSQIATIGLAAQADVLGVIIGSIVGHAACTGAAVLGGKHLAEHIDEKLVGIVGGIMFLLFGAHSLWTGPE